MFVIRVFPVEYYINLLKGVRNLFTRKRYTIFNCMRYDQTLLLQYFIVHIIVIIYFNH